MAGNTTLSKAKEKKNDEFYTQLVDIEQELKHYKKHFLNKVILCNCDDPYESNFFKYFAVNFNYLGLKKLICTCYDSSPIAYTQLSFLPDVEEKKYPNKNRRAYKIEITEVDDYNGDGAVDLSDVEYLLKNKKNTLSLLKGNGDFRSEECIELLKVADVVVTNPPFSLFREYVSLLIEYNKFFIIIGNQNALHYKEIFPLIQTNKVWLGYNHVKDFLKADGTIQKFGNVIWLTNLDIQKRHRDLDLFKHYTIKDYPKYMNLDAIDVSSVVEIPEDYYGLMGVPDSFLEAYNPAQFEIVGLGCGDMAKEIGITKNHRGRTDIAYFDKNGDPKCPYSRIIIRRKDNEN
ncbi:MAG: adenine-specific methyltransferase EcoRI family protein [Clostridia bacterium]|nr:adenine-specific methyltransferase EcoRI family protein [Clostridia bacterium]